MKATRPLKISVLSLLVCASAPTLSAATVQYWATGVSKSGGYQSVAQGGSLYCWAATSSNLLAHYFSSASERGISVSASAPTSSADLFSWFQANFPNQGNQVEIGLNKYISENGSYFNGNEPSVVDSGSFINSQDGGVAISNIFIEALSQGSPVGISYNLGTPISHAVAAWGIEYDNATNIVSKIWMTDSSGDTDGLIEFVAKNTPSQTIGNQFYPGGYLLFEETVDPETGSTTQSGGYRIFRMTWLKPPEIPEPSALGFLAGTLALAFAATRRSRRKRK